MLGKLIKYELRASGRLIPLVYVVVVLLTAAGAALSAVRAYVYMTLSFGLLFFAGAAAMIITYVIVFLRFYKGVFGAEGYLALTLPVTTAQVYLAKTIVATIWMMLSGVISVGAWLAAFAAIFRAAFLESDIPYYFFEGMYEFFTVFLSPGAVLFLILLAIVGFLSFAAQVYFCVTIANIKPFNSLGLGAAVIAFVAIRIVTRILSALLTAAIPLGITFDPYSGWAFTQHYGWWDGMGSYAVDSFSLGLGANLLTLLYAFALPILTVWLIDHKVNIK